MGKTNRTDKEFLLEYAEFYNRHKKRWPNLPTPEEELEKKKRHRLRARISNQRKLLRRIARERPDLLIEALEGLQGVARVEVITWSQVEEIVHTATAYHIKGE